MPIISNDDLTPVIVSFSVEPQNQEKLLDAALENLNKVMKTKEGFISASFHKSFDGKQIINYAQWKSHTLYEMAINFLTQEEVKIGEKMLEIGEADWHIYKLVEMIGTQTITISKENDIITVINILSVEPDSQSTLVNVWLDFLNNVIKNQSGFIGAALHKSVDGLRVVNYSQWKSNVDVQRVFSNPAIKSYLEKQKMISNSNANFYQIIHTLN